MSIKELKELLDKYPETWDVETSSGKEVEVVEVHRTRYGYGIVRIV